MAKKTVADISFAGKRVLMRADFNVPLDADRNITDDGRIQGALPTIRKILDDGGRLILMSHLGRPKGEPDAKFSLAPVAKRLGEILGKDVKLAPDCVGDQVKTMADALKDGDCMVLENLRFHEAETVKDKKAKDDPVLRSQKDEFASSLASLADIYVNDAFGTCHRDNASMLTVPQKMEGKPRVIGFPHPEGTQVPRRSGSQPCPPVRCCPWRSKKYPTRSGLSKNVLPKCDKVLVGGAMAYTFQAADGVATGKSLVEPDFIEKRQKNSKPWAATSSFCRSIQLWLQKFQVALKPRLFSGAIPEGMMGLDIGPETVKVYADIISSAKTVAWNGPMGVFETPPFDSGTLSIAKTLATATENGAVTIIGGGDSAAAIDVAGLSDKMTHISTGGGASLEFLEGKPFAPIDVLDDVLKTCVPVASERFGIRDERIDCVRNLMKQLDRRLRLL